MMQENIRNIIKEKRSNICLAADVDYMKELFDLIKLLGDKICILKIHHDIILDFFDNYSENVKKLNSLKEEYNFLIWEDRKYADIGTIMARQVNNVSKWADIISVHSISGKESLEQLNNMSLIIIGNLSTKDNIIDSNYMIRTSQIVDDLPNVIGVVCQNKFSNTKLNIVPGISLTDGEDGMGQKYSSISSNSKSFADIFVIGRAITKSEMPRKTIDVFLSKISI